MPRLTTTALLALATLFATAAISSAQTADPAGQPTSTFTQSQPAPIERDAPAADNQNAQRTPMPMAQQPARLVDTHTTLTAGQSLTTSANIASAQPTNGVFVRVGQNSSIKAIATDPNHVELRVEQGIANISVHHPDHGSEILVDLPGGQTGLLKDGLYTFNASTNTVRVLKGEADAYLGSNVNAKPIKVKEDHSITFSGPAARSVEFAPLQARADLVPYVGGPASDGPNPGYNYRPYGPYGDGFYGAYGDPYYAYGWGYPYYGWGYPGFGLGLGFGGFYGGGFRGGYGGFHGGGFHGGGGRR